MHITTILYYIIYLRNYNLKVALYLPLYFRCNNWLFDVFFVNFSLSSNFLCDMICKMVSHVQEGRREF